MALLMVLLIVVAITILATGFLASTDAELGCGTNMLLRLQMDQLAESGLDHGRGLLLQPQDVPASFWTTGASAQQLAAGSQDYYDVHVSLDTLHASDNATYDVTCDAYHKLPGGVRTGQCSLSAVLRLDPCVALAVKTDTTLWNGFKVYGDVYSMRSLVNNGTIAGDVFATSLTGTGATLGRFNPQTLALAWPSAVTANFSNPLYARRTLVGGLLPAGTYQPDSIWRSGTGDLDVTGLVTVKGMLVASGNATIRVAASGSQFLAARNLAALYVGGMLTIEGVTGLQIDGLVLVGGNVVISPAAANIVITGGMFVGGTLDPGGTGSGVKIVADPMKAAILDWESGAAKPWMPAAGSFYKSIRRQ